MEWIKEYIFIIVILFGCTVGFTLFNQVYCHDHKIENNVSPLELSFTTLDGDTISISQFKGKKPVMLVFFTSWCGYCRLEMPNINKAYENFKEIEVIGIDPGWNDSINRLKNFIKRNKIAFKVSFDNKGKLGRLYGIRGVPTIIIIDINGKIQYRGNRVPKDLKEQIILSMAVKDKNGMK